MFLPKKSSYYLLLLTIFLLPLSSYTQTIQDSYQNLWKRIILDTISKERTLSYLEVYIQKAQKENNLKEEYRALEKKAFSISPSASIPLISEMEQLAIKSKNDSLIERSISTKASFYYINRNFKEALNASIQAEALNIKKGNIYQLNFVRIDIGNIYYHTKNYTKAKEYFIKAKNYYKTKDNYNYLQGYMVSLYSLSKTYWQLNKPDSLKTAIETSENTLSLLNNQDRVLETAYINYVKGGYYFLSKDFNEAQNYFLKALPDIRKNEDFTNEYVIYLYLGKIAWEQNKKEKAITYFTKIDQLFQKRNFLNYELRHAYDYLIAYYKETAQPQKQLEVTEHLITLNHQFEKEQQDLTSTLHYELETKKLEASKTDLQKQLSSNKYTYSVWLIGSGLLCLALCGYAYWQTRQKKQLRLRFNELINGVQSANEPFEKNTDKEKSVIETKNLTATEERLLQALQKFENEKGFLKPLKLDDFAAELNTNRNTLSKLINTNKGVNFNQYINSLRVKQVLIDLKNNNRLRQLSMQGLAETYGFTNAKTFSIQFKAETSLSPAYFIEQLQLDDEAVPQ